MAGKWGKKLGGDRKKKKYSAVSLDHVISEKYYKVTVEM
jgi:hypothetical protein